MVVVRLKDVIMLCVDSIFKANLMSRQAIELRIGSASLDTHSITPNLEELRFSIHPDFIFRFTLVNKRDRSLASGFVGMAENVFSDWLQITKKNRPNNSSGADSI